MPAPELDRQYRKQRAVFWCKVGDDRYGQPIVTPPVELMVRWVEERHEALDPHGATVAADVKVVLDRRIPIGSVAWLGGLSDLPGTEFTPSSNVFQLISQPITPDIKGRVIRLTGSLMRYKNVLPVVDP
jgi:hypothetical protein